MTVYNRPKSARAAIDSVLEQTFGGWELLIGDDSDPQRGLSDLPPDHRIFPIWMGTTAEERQRTCRYATVINFLFRHARGRYITYLCHDDLYTPTRLERMIAKLAEGNNVVYGSQQMIGSIDAWRPADRVLDDAYHVVDMNSVTHTREAFEEVHGWDDSADLWRDADAHFWRRLTGAGYQFVPVDDPDTPTDIKHYLDDGIDAKLRRGETPW